MNETIVKTGSIAIGNDLPLTLIAGPCAVETLDHALFMAEHLAKLAKKHHINLVYKSSFDKANRTRLDSPRGVGLEEAQEIFTQIRKQFHLPVLTDIHLPQQAAAIAPFVDILQIPAFLCRQSDLLIAAAQTNLPVNVKKGQYLAPWDMRYVVEKITSAGKGGVMVCERGTSFGYNRLVNDFCALPILREQCKCPIVFDATHSVQQPAGQNGVSGGERRFAPLLARAAVAIGVAAVFIETHQQPDRAPSDGANMIPLADMDGVIADLLRFDELRKTQNRQSPR